jgi:hypothetical protein
MLRESGMQANEMSGSWMVAWTGFGQGLDRVWTGSWMVAWAGFGRTVLPAHGDSLPSAAVLLVTDCPKDQLGTRHHIRQHWHPPCSMKSCIDRAPDAGGIVSLYGQGSVTGGSCDPSFQFLMPVLAVCTQMYCTVAEHAFGMPVHYLDDTVEA